MKLARCWRNLGSAVAVLVVVGLTQTARAQDAPKAPTAAEDQIRNATKLFYVAFNSALHSDLDPMSTVWSHRADVSNLTAAGGWTSGWNEVHMGFRNMARLYPNGRIAPQIVLVVADGELGFSVCRETGELRSAEGPMVRFNQRATNIFRLENGKWKLIHHHADSSPSSPEGVTR